jgi:hypothetical protein
MNVLDTAINMLDWELVRCEVYLIKLGQENPLRNDHSQRKI